MPGVFAIDGDVFIVLCDPGWLPPKGAQSTKARILQQNQQTKYHVHRMAVKTVVKLAPQTGTEDGWYETGGGKPVV